MNTMPYTTRNTDHTERANTGNAKRWDCAVSGCTHGGTAATITRAVFLAARHSASHTDTELASTGYVVRFNWAAAAATRLAS